MTKQKPRTRLVMIQGDKAALYEGAEQLCVFDGALQADVEMVERVRKLSRNQAAEYKKQGEQYEASQS